VQPHERSSQAELAQHIASSATSVAQRSAGAASTSASKANNGDVSAVRSAVQASQQQPQRPQTSAEGSTVTGQLSEAQIAALPPLARVRFDMAGLPVAWVSTGELRQGVKAEDVVSRDPLRAAEGSVATGYTIEEAVVLLRCSHVPLQRAGANSNLWIPSTYLPTSLAVHDVKLEQACFYGMRALLCAMRRHNPCGVHMT
jgi:hypothetical protein